MGVAFRPARARLSPTRRGLDAFDGLVRVEGLDGVAHQLWRVVARVDLRTHQDDCIFDEVFARGLIEAREDDEFDLAGQVLKLHRAHGVALPRLHRADGGD